MKSPARVAAGRRNRAKWRGFSMEGLERLRDTARANQPWHLSTGPRTVEGRRRSARNGSIRGRTRLAGEYLRLCVWCLRHLDRLDGFEYPRRRMAPVDSPSAVECCITRMSEIAALLPMQSRRRRRPFRRRVAPSMDAETAMRARPSFPNDYFEVEGDVSADAGARFLRKWAGLCGSPRTCSSW